MADLPYHAKVAESARIRLRAPRRSRVSAALTCLATVSLLLGPVVALPAQADTAVRIDRLRARVKASPDSFPIVLALGQALARSASERERDWRERLEARKVLEKAFRLRPKDPRPFLELGLLLRKQGMRVDAQRMLRRAEARASDASTQLSHADLAQVHLQLALIYEVWWEDGEHLGALPADFTRSSCPGIAQYTATSAAGPAPPSSPRSNLIAYNFVCPRVFDELMENWRPLNLYETDFAAMVGHFRMALRFDPTLAEAGVHLLRHLAAAEAWDEYLPAAQTLVHQRPTDARALLFLGLGYHATGDRERADSAFTAALDHATPLYRDAMLEPSQLLRQHDSATFEVLREQKRVTLGDIFWRARDPLFLTAGNERLAEHLSRLAYVEVAYAAPQSGLSGRWSDRGAAWMRYGRPLRIRALPMGSGAQGFSQGTGILEFWDYGKDSPDLVFVRQRTYRYARYGDMTRQYVRYARERVPELYAPAHPRFVAKIPFQAATFRASDGGSVLEVYGALPSTTLRQASAVPRIETGMFVVTGDFWEPRATVRGSRPAEAADTLLDGRFPLAAGNYVVSLEAIAGDAAAQYRQRVDVPSFGDSLALSDLLLVDRFDSPLSPAADRAELHPAVSRTSVFARGQPIGVVWEIYGLHVDSNAVARYRVRAEVADSKHENAVLRALGAEITPGIPDTVGARRRRSGAEWGASRVPRADGAVVEYVSLDLPDAAPGSYRVFITVTDRLTGRSLTVHRPFAIKE